MYERVLRRIMAGANRAGLPRPLLKRDGKSTPVPWVGGNCPAEGRWAGIDVERAVLAHYGDLCIVCGERLTAGWVRLLLFGQWAGYSPDPIAHAFKMSAPAPLQAHPKCALLAATVCPHLHDQTFPAMTIDGEKLTSEQLRDLARSKEVVA